jgi:signal transduction histidine kinase
VLEDLPLGVCALGPDRDVVIWNRALEQCSGLSASEAVGVSLDALQGPLAESLRLFVAGEAAQSEVHLGFQGKERSLSLSRSQVQERAAASAETAGVVVLVEDLTERKALAAQVAHQDRLASVGRLAAGVAHEIGNPLTGIACLAQNLAREATSTDVRERLGRILSEAHRIDAIVRVLLGYSHAGTAHGLRVREPVDLRTCVGEAITLVRLSREAKSVSCESRVGEGLLVSGDRQRLVQVFVNLIANACDASSAGALVTVDAQLGAGGVSVFIRDRGTGMDEAVRSRMFEPFFTTKPPGQGTGLGLPLVAAIVHEHGGRLRVESWPGVGTTVELELPVGELPLVPGTRVAETLGGAHA